MAQIKLGFDRVPVPFVPSLQPLFDIVRGVPLRDANNNPIVTEIEIPLPSLAKAAKASSILITNESDSRVRILENFPEVSQVSSSLLGIPRAETQLSLFSDVSTYGLDPDEFEFYQFVSGGSTPRGYYRRNNPVFGRRFFPRLTEETEEQALAVEAYPVNFDFARGPRFDNFNQASYERFVRFVKLGNQLYEDYKDTHPSFARNNFLDPEEVTVEEGEVVYRISESDGYDALEKWTIAWMDMRDGDLDDPKNPGNPVLFLEGFGSDVTRPGTSSGGVNFGLLQSRKSFRYQPGRISGFTFGFRCSVDETSVDNVIEWGIGNPTDQYVFQVRGASFNIVRRSTVPLSDSVLENQLLNPQDQELITSREPIDDTEFFELVIPRERFNADTVDGNGPSGYLIDPTKVTMYKIEFGWYGAIGAKFYVYVPTGIGGARWVLMHTLVIENQLGEPCLQDPNFQFRYTLDIRDRSNLREPQFLYKYGASCYIDGGDEGSSEIFSYTSEENIVTSGAFSPLLGIFPKDTLANRADQVKPNKKSIFPSSIRSQSDQLTEIQAVEVEGCPAFGHHYAPSLHARETGTERGIQITNGGSSIEIVEDNPINITDITQADPAVVTVESNHNYYTGQKVFIDDIQGMTELNTQEFYIAVVSDTAFLLYSDANLENSIDSSNFSSYTDGGQSTGIPIFLFEEDDSKIINQGIYGSYIEYKSEREADIRRITGGFIKGPGSIPAEVSSGGIVETANLDLSQVRFTNYDAIATTSYPFNSDVFDVNFLNPTRRDIDTQFCEFLIGVTEFKPIIEQEETASGGLQDVIKFLQKDGVTVVDPDLEDYLFEEFTQQGISRNRDGFESNETIFSRGVKMDIDYRLPNPAGEDSGRCSGVRFRLEPREGFNVSYDSTNPQTGLPDNVLIFEFAPTTLLGNVRLAGGEFGIGETESQATSSGIRFVSDVQEFISDPLTGELAYFVRIDNNPSQAEFKIWLTPLAISDKNNLNIEEGSQRFTKRRIFSFQPKPLYLVIQMRDNARINNVTITEFFPDSSNSFCPEWLVNDRLDVVSSGGSQTGLPAANFESDQRLESASIDTSLNQPLRPGKVKDTIYVAQNQQDNISLENIYGPDRSTITAGLLNTRATFFQAKSLEDASLNIVNFNLITKEQK